MTANGKYQPKEVYSQDTDESKRFIDKGIELFVALIAGSGFLITQPALAGVESASANQPAIVTADNEYETRAFLEAVSTDDIDKARELLDQGVNVNSKDEEGRTALMLAAGSRNIIIELVKRGADVNAKDVNGKTALMYRVSYQPKTYLVYVNTGRPVPDSVDDMIELLIKKGADVNARVKSGLTALDYATRQIDRELLLEYGARGKSYYAAKAEEFFDAVVRGDTVKVQELLKQRVNPDEERNGVTALMRAVRNGDIAMAQVLLDNGADVNAHHLRGFTPLMEAVKKDDAEMVCSVPALSGTVV